MQFPSPKSKSGGFESPIEDEKNFSISLTKHPFMRRQSKFEEIPNISRIKAKMGHSSPLWALKSKKVLLSY